MVSSQVFIGIDPTANRRDPTCAVIDENLQILLLQTAPVEQVLEHVLSYSHAVCAVDAPSGPNRNFMADPAYREQLGLPPTQTNYATFRVAEYALRSRGIYIYNTTQEEKDLAEWVHEAWKIYEQLRKAGYVDFPQDGPRRMFETYPYAVFTTMIGSRPYPKNSLQGLLQRQLVLYDVGINVPDPMGILEELTEHRLRTGNLNLSGIYSHDQLDALVSAFTAYMLARKPEKVLVVGEAAEGVILVPGTSLKDSYD